MAWFSTLRPVCSPTSEAAVPDPPSPTSLPGRLTPDQLTVARQHLQEVLSSSAFAGSKRAQEFLQLVVEHALNDRTDSLKERMIGVEMFGRPVDYDTANDAVVRVKATEVRRRLAQYYQEAGRAFPLRIELPVGSYVPRFVWPQEESNPAPETTAAPARAKSPPETPASSGHGTAVPAVTAGRRSWLRSAVFVSLLGLVLVTGVLAIQKWWGTFFASPI